MSSLLRSTKFVRYIAGAARTLILNSAKTAETHLLVNTKAVSVVNNVIIRDYSSTKKAESLEPLLNRLDNDVRKFGRLSKKDIDEVFDEIKAKHNITSSQSLLVIRCCGELVPEELPEQRTLLVQKIWSVLTERGVPMDISHYNALLRVYIENQHTFSPAEFLEELERKGLQPNRVTYQRLMWRYCQEGDVDGATKVLEKMRELSFPVSEPVLNALVMGHAFHGDTDGAKAVLETMAGAGLQPSNRTYSLLASGYAKKGDLDGVEAVLNNAKEKDIVFTDKDILEVIEWFASSGGGEQVERLFPHLQRAGGYTQDVCNVVLRLVNRGQVDAAKRVMRTMPNARSAEDAHMYRGAFFVKQLIKAGLPADRVVATCRELQEEGLVPSALFIATEHALQQGSADAALVLFKELQKDGVEIRQHYFWPLLVSKAKERDDEGFMQILKEMTSRGHVPTGEALRDYVLPYLLAQDSPDDVITKLQIANVPVSHASRNLVCELLERGQLQEAADVALRYRPAAAYAQVARSLINGAVKTKDIKSFVTVLHVLASRADDAEDAAVDHREEVGRIVLRVTKALGSVSSCEQLLDSLLAIGVGVSTATAEAIEAHLGQGLTASISEKLARLASEKLSLAPLQGARRGAAETASVPALAELLRRVEAGEAEGNLPRLQKRLLLACIEHGDVATLETLLDKLMAANFEISNPTLSHIVETFAQADRVDKALEYKAILDARAKDFINVNKVMSVAAALVRADRFDEALKFLEENRRGAAEPSFLLNSRCWQMLNYLAEQKNVAKTKKMTETLMKLDYVLPTNILLGPSIKVHLLNDDIDGAMEEFEHCCNTYRSTPWKGEIMKALILKEDASKLQYLADISTKIHGEVNILHDLVLAFVECGRLRQARRILATPGLQARHQRLSTACERYVQDDKPEYLEGLLEATKELSNFDRSIIFHALLQSYCKNDETSKALGLWTLLQEEGEVPSDNFLRLLAKHLRSKNQAVPFVLPEPEKPKPDKAKQQQQQKEKQQKLPTSSKLEYSNTIEKLVTNGQLDQAVELAHKCLDDNVIPKSNIFKYLLKNLALKGDVEAVERLGRRLSDATKRNVTYDDKLTLAVFTRGGGAEHVRRLHAAAAAAPDAAAMERLLQQFPRSSALATVMDDAELFDKCQEVCELAANKGITLPMNLLWMECVLADKEQRADDIWHKHLKAADSVVFRRLLQEGHTRNQPQIIEKLIDYLKTNPSLTMATVGNAYSRLINLHLVRGDTEHAKVALEKAIADGVSLEDINNNSLKRLKEALQAVGQEFNYEIPMKTVAKSE